MPTTQIKLTLRLTKGSALNYEEMDGNLTALRSAILQTADELGASRVVIGDEPAPADRDGVLWIPIPSKGFFLWNGTKWERIKEPILHGIATGTGGAYALTLPDAFDQLSDLTGRIITFEINHNNPGAATLNITGTSGTPLGQVAIRKRGTLALSANELTADSVAHVVYDGAEFQLLNPTPVDQALPVLVYRITDPLPSPGNSKVFTFNDTLKNLIPDGYSVRLVAGGSVNNGYSAGDEIDIANVVGEVAEASFGHAFSVTVTAASITVALILPAGGGLYLSQKNGAYHHNPSFPFNPSDWSLKVSAWRFQ